MHLKNPNMWAAVTALVGSGLQLGGYQSQPVAYGCFAVTALLLLYSAIRTAMLPGGAKGRWRAFWALRFGGEVPLPVAAQLAYETARKKNSLWAHAAERLGTDTSPTGILDYVATYFGMHVPITGKRPPSTADEIIDTTQAGRGTFEGGAVRLELDDGRTVFTDLRVAAKDVRLVIAKMSEKVFPGGRG